MKKYFSALFAAAMAMSFSAHAADPLRIIVSFSPGGPVDTVARVLAGAMGKELGRSVIVENKPGANGAIGAQEVMRSDPDGNTLWITSVGAAAINSALYKKLSYNMQRDFKPVSLVVNNVELFVVNKNNPANNMAEFIENAKKQKAPTPIASSGVGSIPHLAMEQLKDATGANLLHVPYKGAAPAINDLLGGQVSGFFGDIPGLLGHVRGGSLKALGIAAPKRDPALPQVKTFEEQGIKGVDTVNWYGLFAPAKTPDSVIQSLNKAVRDALASPEVKQKLEQLGTDPESSSPEELAKLLSQDTAKWAKLIQAKNIRLD